MSFTYCVSAAGSNQASQIMCVSQDIAFTGMEALVTGCNATQESFTTCTNLAKTAYYGVCGNRAVCNLFYNGPINTCFNDVLNATITTCVTATTTPAATMAPTGSVLPLALGLSFAGVALLAGTLVCCKYRSKISDLWSRCCNGGYQKI